LEFNFTIQYVVYVPILYSPVEKLFYYSVDTEDYYLDMYVAIVF